jgi:hypothetical protein
MVLKVACYVLDFIADGMASFLSLRKDKRYNGQGTA